MDKSKLQLGHEALALLTAMNSVQQYNTLALAWSVAGQMFSIGARYQWVTISYLVGFIVPVPFYLAWRFTKIECFRYFYTGIVLWYMVRRVNPGSSITQFGPLTSLSGLALRGRQLLYFYLFPPRRRRPVVAAQVPP